MPSTLMAALYGTSKLVPFQNRFELSHYPSRAKFN